MPDVVIYDGDCGICARVKNIVESLDWLGTMRWIPLHSAEAAGYGIPREALERAVYLVTGSRTTSGFAAVQGMILRIPVAYFVAASIISKRPWTALLFAFLLSPLAGPIGQPAYELVARNRYRIAGSTCDNRIR